MSTRRVNFIRPRRTFVRTPSIGSNESQSVRDASNEFSSRDASNEFSSRDTSNEFSSREPIRREPINVLASTPIGSNESQSVRNASNEFSSRNASNEFSSIESIRREPLQDDMGLFLFRPPSGQPFKDFIFKLDTKYQNYLILNNLNSKQPLTTAWPNLANLNQWKVQKDVTGIYILILLYLEFPTWQEWSPEKVLHVGINSHDSGSFPLKLESVNRLDKNKLVNLFQKLFTDHPGKIIKRKLFLLLAKTLAKKGFLSKEEKELVDDREFERCLELKVDAVRNELARRGKTPSSLKGRAHFNLILELISSISHQNKNNLDVHKLITMTNSERSQLSQKYGLENNFCQLVNYLIKIKIIHERYSFIKTQSFWSFYQRVSNLGSKAVSCLASMYLNGLMIKNSFVDTLNESETIALLYHVGILERDLEPERIAILPKNIGISRRPFVDGSTYPRGIVVKSKFNGELRKSDLKLYDHCSEISSAICGDIFFNISEILELDDDSYCKGPKFYKDWIKPERDNEYSHLSIWHINKLMKEREISINCSDAAKRAVLNTLDKVDGLRWVNRASDQVRALMLALCKHFNLNNLNYDTSLILLANKLYDVGITKDDNSVKAPRDIKRKKLDTYDPLEVINMAIEGYRITSDINVDYNDINIWESNENFELELDLLIRYPIKINKDSYIELRMLSWVKLVMIIEMLFPEPQDLVLDNKFELLFFLSRGYIYPHPDYSRRKENYQQLRALSPKTQKFIYKIYGLDENTINRFFWLYLAINLPPILHPLNDGLIERILDTLEIVPPPLLDRQEYFITNLEAYHDLLHNDRSKVIPLEESNSLANTLSSLTSVNLNLLTDQQIIDGIGLIPCYTDRKVLISNVRHLWHSQAFFISIARRSINKETTNMIEVTDLNEIMLGYGTFDNYYCYDLDELHGAFYRGEDAFYHFRHPEDTNLEFSIPEIKQLYFIVEYLFNRGLGNTDEICKLRSRIDDGLQHFDLMKKINKETYEVIMNLSLEKKESIRQWLTTIFESGMYMRRWEGPGKPYPYTIEETLNGRDPQNVIDSIPSYLAQDKENEISMRMEDDSILSYLQEKRGKLSEKMINDLKLIYFIQVKERNIWKKMGPEREVLNNLGTLRYHKGALIRDKENHTLVEKFLRASGIRKNVCIRQSSQPIIVSSAYYLKAFFKDDLNGFIPDLVEPLPQ